MKTIERLRNPIQDYAWGSHTAIGELLSQPIPSERPQAELWMGAHPKSPSHVLINGQTRSLVELLKEFPTEILGDTIADRFSNQLPFLFKVLAADVPLSIQAHPDRLQAREGFERENRLGVPLGAASRNYRDDNHKPEIICALTPFRALCGFRSFEEILSSLEDLRPVGLSQEIADLRRNPGETGLRIFFGTLMNNPAEKNRRIVQETLEAVNQSPRHQLEAQWMGELQAHFPGDVGVIAPVLLNLLELRPGEALYLPAGVLHAYLDGVGIELMANSDNVLRGGLTPKHVDVPELLRVLTFQTHPIQIISPEETSSGALVFETPAEEFRLAMIRVDPQSHFASRDQRSVEILLCTEGEAVIEDTSGRGSLDLAKGDSVLIPAAVKGYRLDGNATIYRADVP